MASGKIQMSTALNPTAVFSGVLLKNNATRTQALDISKHYLLIASFLYSSSSSRMNVWKIESNTLSQIVTSVGNANASASIADATLTVAGTNTTENTEFTLLQMD